MYFLQRSIRNDTFLANNTEVQASAAASDFIMVMPPNINIDVAEPVPAYTKIFLQEAACNRLLATNLNVAPFR